MTKDAPGFYKREDEQMTDKELIETMAQEVSSIVHVEAFPCTTCRELAASFVALHRVLTNIILPQLKAAALHCPLPKVERPREVNGWRCEGAGSGRWILVDKSASISITDDDRLAIADVCANPTEEVEE